MFSMKRGGSQSPFLICFIIRKLRNQIAAPLLLPALIVKLLIDQTKLIPFRKRRSHFLQPFSSLPIPDIRLFFDRIACDSFRPGAIDFFDQIFPVCVPGNENLRFYFFPGSAGRPVQKQFFRWLSRKKYKIPKYGLHGFRSGNLERVCSVPRIICVQISHDALQAGPDHGLFPAVEEEVHLLCICYFSYHMTFLFPSLFLFFLLF